MSAAHGKPGLEPVPNPTDRAGVGDQMLIDLCNTGDDEAFAVLTGRYYGRVFAMCYRSVGNRADAEDLAQEVFVRVHQNLPVFRRGAGFKPWLNSITFNRILTFLKRRNARREVSEAGSDGVPSRLPGPDRCLRVSLAMDRVTSAMAALPQHYRDVIVMHTLMGMSYQDVAAALDTSVSNVKSWLFRARRTLCEREADSLAQLSEF